MEEKSLLSRGVFRSKIRSANVKLPEIFFGYFLGPVGALLASGIFTSFLNKYYTDVLFANLLHEGRVQLFLTLLPLVSAALIVVGNFIVGQIIERTKSRAGKARPWILLSSVLLSAASILMFVMPTESNPVLRMVLTAVSYNLYYAVAYPLYNTANSTLVPLSTRNSKQRGVLASANNVAGLAVMGIGSMVFPVLLGLLVVETTPLERARNVWFTIFFIVGIITFVASTLQFYFTRERVTEETFGSEKTVKKPSIKGQLVSVTSDKSWWIIILFYLLFQVSGGIKNLSMTYFCQKILNNSFWGASLDANTAAGMTQTLLAVLGAIPMAAAVAIVLPLANKFGKRTVVFFGLIFGVAGGVLAGAFSHSVVAVGIGVALKCLGSSPACYLILAMISDVLDHIEAKRGFRADGLTMSVYSSIMVAATPLSQALFNGISGSGSSLFAIEISYIWIETIAYALCAVMILFFTVERGLAADQKVIRERQKQETIAAGEEWIEPEERLRQEEARAEREEEEARKRELRLRCERKGLSFEEEEEKYQKKRREKNGRGEDK